MKKILIALLTTLPVLCAPLQAQDSAALQALLTNDAGRPDADKARDAGRRPAEVLSFVGVQSGQTVVDLIAAARTVFLFPQSSGLRIEIQTLWIAVPIAPDLRRGIGLPRERVAGCGLSVHRQAQDRSVV